MHLLQGCPARIPAQPVVKRTPGVPWSYLELSGVPGVRWSSWSSWSTLGYPGIRSGTLEQSGVPWSSLE